MLLGYRSSDMLLSTCLIIKCSFFLVCVYRAITKLCCRFYAHISPGSLGVYRFKYRCVGLPKADGYSPRDIEMSIVENSTNRYENLIYGSVPAPPGGEAKTTLTPALIKLFSKTGGSETIAGSWFSAVPGQWWRQRVTSINTAYFQCEMIACR